MTTFNQTITNSMNLFGPQATNNWGVMVWGVDSWAYSAFDLPTTVIKLITNSISSDSTITTVWDISALIQNSLSITGDMYDESISDVNGFYQEFGSGRNAENRPLTSYNGLSDITTSYTQIVDPGTSYTQIN